MAVNRTASVSFVRSWREEITWIIVHVCVVAATLLLLEHSVTCAYAAHHRFPFHFSLAPLPLCPAAVASGVQSFAFPSPPVPLDIIFLYLGGTPPTLCLGRPTTANPKDYVVLNPLFLLYAFIE